MEFVKLGDIALIGSGQSAPQDINDYILNGETFIKVSNLDDIIYDDNENKACKISLDYVFKKKLKKYPMNSIIFAKSGLSCNKNRVYLTKKDSYIVNHLCVIFNISEVYNPKWLTYFIKFHNVTKYIKDESYPSISLKDISNIKIPVIDISKQNEVVFEIKKIEELLKLTENCLIYLDNIVKSQFIEMFGKLEDTEYPIDTLNNICEFIKDGIHQTPTYTEDEDGYIFVSSKDVTSGKIDWDNTKRIPKELHDQLYSRIAPKKNDILLSKNGTIGFAVLVEEDRIFDIYVSLAILRQNKLNPVFMKEQLNAEDCQKQFYSSLKGVRVPNLHLGEIKKTKVIVPPIELQNKFGDFVKQIDKSKYFGGVCYGI